MNLNGLLNYFLSRRSTEELLPVILRINKPLKEVSEALSVFWELANTVKEDQILVELCSGRHALFSLVSLLNLRTVKYSIATDVLPPYEEVITGRFQRFEYFQYNIFDEEYVGALRRKITRISNGNLPVSVVGIHCCKRLAIRVLEIGAGLYSVASKVRVFLVPCCIDHSLIKYILKTNDYSYETWIKTILRYADLLGYKILKVKRLEGMLSDKNVLLVLEFDKQWR